jgi:hypothetical protein
VKYGQGFGEKMAHLALTGVAKAESKYYYRVDMKWKQFQPVFFPEKPGRPGYKDLCSLPTIGWKEQGELGEEGIGFVHNWCLAPDQQTHPLIGRPWICNSSATVGFDWSFEGSQTIYRTSAPQGSPDLGK